MNALRATARFSDDGETYSEDGRYRLWLDIRLHEREITRTACVLLMNPSTARVKNGFLVPDPTVAKVKPSAKAPGFLADAPPALARALAVHQEFKRRVIAPLPTFSPWAISQEKILDTIEAIEAGR
jgi:hypothetical protein